MFFFTNKLWISLKFDQIEQSAILETTKWNVLYMFVRDRV